MRTKRNTTRKHESVDSMIRTEESTPVRRPPHPHRSVPFRPTQSCENYTHDLLRISAHTAWFSRASFSGQALLMPTHSAWRMQTPAGYIFCYRVLRLGPQAGTPPQHVVCAGPGACESVLPHSSGHIWERTKSLGESTIHATWPPKTLCDTPCTNAGSVLVQRP